MGSFERDRAATMAWDRSQTVPAILVTAIINKELYSHVNFFDHEHH
jgi:hypothetical protein